MGFKIKSDNTVKWPVKVSVPQDGGTFITQKFTGIIKLLDSEEFDRATEADDKDAALCKAALVGWEGVQNDDGTEAAFSPELMEALCKVPYFRRPVIAAYSEAVQGGAIKN